jgi:uncharacterized membrane protein required for colicin V production
MALLATSTFAQVCAGWLAVLPVVALGIHGAWHGTFLATIAGLQVLASFLAAAAGAAPLAVYLEPLGCPAPQALVAAYLLIFLGALVATRLAVGAVVKEGVCRLPLMPDRVIGACIGAWAGVLLAGALLVGWSMADMPAWSRFDSSHLPLDAGRRVLWTFARWAVPPGAAWQAVLDGDPPARTAAAAGGVPSGTIRAGEPFVDTNGNGVRDGSPVGAAEPGDGAERYLDVDGDGEFTADMPWRDLDGDGVRNIGLGECYRLAEWRRVRVRHAPRITSAEAAEIQETHPLDEPIYRATVTDVDAGDVVRFSLRQPADVAAGRVEIDAANGDVTLVESADFEKQKHIVFVVVATDGSGLSTEQEVRVRVRDVPLE